MGMVIMEFYLDVLRMKEFLQSFMCKLFVGNAFILGMQREYSKL